jgi:hypothetical protein
MVQSTGSHPSNYSGVRYLKFVTWFYGDFEVMGKEQFASIRFLPLVPCVPWSFPNVPLEISSTVAHS